MPGHACEASRPIVSRWPNGTDAPEQESIVNMFPVPAHDIGHEERRWDGGMLGEHIGHRWLEGLGRAMSKIVDGIANRRGTAHSGME